MYLLLKLPYRFFESFCNRYNSYVHENDHGLLDFKRNSTFKCKTVRKFKRESAVSKDKLRIISSEHRLCVNTVLQDY